MITDYTIYFEHSVVFFELPVLSTSQAKTLTNSDQLIGSASPLSHVIPIAMSTVQHNANKYATNSTPNVSKEEFIKQFNNDEWPETLCGAISDLLWKHRDTFALNHHELGKCDTFKQIIPQSRANIGEYHLTCTNQ